jgi:hypothetical protein
MTKLSSANLEFRSSLGNFLATLHERFPVLDETPFISDHPLFIPCAIAAAFSLFSFHITHQGFREVSSFDV